VLLYVRILLLEKSIIFIISFLNATKLIDPYAAIENSKGEYNDLHQSFEAYLTIAYFSNLGVFLVLAAIFEIDRLPELHSCVSRETYPKQNFFSSLLTGIVFTCLCIY